MQLYDYQQKLITETAQAIRDGNKNVMVQLPTGGGKTVCFSSIVERFYNKSKKRCIILVHRDELLQQTVKTLWKWYKIEAQPITADTKQIYDRKCYVGMVETLNRRLGRNANFLPEIGLVICDERHMGNFNKIHQYFNCINIGFSATPLASNKKEPLNKYYQTIVCGPQINELIKLGCLVQNHTYSIKGVNRANLKVVHGRFDEKFMGDEFSKMRHVKNTIINYKSICPGTKAICYNVNVEHSKIMHQAWLDAGYISFHVDDSTPSDERALIFRKFENTPGSILNNVGIATMGYDNPSIETVIENRATTSPVLAIQMAGRGGRPNEGKKFFTILDMGGNHIDVSKGGHGDWNSDRDWKEAFINPPKGREKLGAAPVKNCPNCMAIIAAQSTICPICSFEFPQRPVNYDPKRVDLELITKNINVAELVKQNEHRKAFYSLCQIGYKVGAYVKHRSGGIISDEVAKKALEEVRKKAEEWCKITNREYDRTVKWLSKKTLYEAMGYDPKKNKVISAISPIENISPF